MTQAPTQFTSANVKHGDVQVTYEGSTPTLKIQGQSIKLPSDPSAQRVLLRDIQSAVKEQIFRSGQMENSQYWSGQS